MTTLASYDPSGCGSQINPGNIGEVLLQGISGPEWASAARIPVVDVGNYFAADNIEQALQQIGATLAGAGGGVVDCRVIQDCIGTAVNSAWGLDYDDLNNHLILTLQNLPLITQPLSSINKVIVTNDPGWPYGAQATMSDLASAITGATAARPWGKVFSPPPTSTDAVTTADAIYHVGPMVRGATVNGANLEFDNKGNLGNGGDHTNSGDGNFLNGFSNVASGNNLIVTGNFNSNLSSTNASVLAGYQHNLSTSDNAAIVAGWHNLIINSPRAAILSGQDNIVNNAFNGVVVGGLTNTVISSGSIIGNGSGNTIAINSSNAFLGAGTGNTVSAGRGFLGAGQDNISAAGWGFLGGGQTNQVTSNAQHGVIVGGKNNLVTGQTAIVVGGDGNFVKDARSAVLGGLRNGIDSQYLSARFGVDANDSMIGAGVDNLIIVDQSFVGSGLGNGITSGHRNFIGSGDHNTIQGSANAIGGGTQNNIVNANNAFVGGGFQNSCTGFGTAIESPVALGTKARPQHSGVFIWQSFTGAANFSSVRADEFVAVAAGGFRFRTSAAGTIGVDLPTGTNSWAAASSAALKGHFEKLDPRSILSRLVRVPIQSYRFKRQTINPDTHEVSDDGYYDELNFGPTAEDWNFEFASVLGEKTIQRQVGDEIVHTPAISDGDKLGVALAAIQGLHSMLDDLKREVARLNQKLEHLSGGQAVPA